jgi:hypothetical protein
MFTRGGKIATGIYAFGIVPALFQGHSSANAVGLLAVDGVIGWLMIAVGLTAIGIRFGRAP